ncbi:MAG: DNA polymerase III subunit delta, partial [Bacteroidales bacterium]|nr:DNA polymerase III subunit delta [Bacteroidales bacterium]
LVLTITALYGYFCKLLVFNQHIRDDSKTQAAALGCNPFFLKDYAAAQKRFPAPKVIKAISLLREYDLKSKGVGNSSTDPGALLQELVYKIMH